MFKSFVSNTPMLAYVVFALFAIEAVFILIINLVGIYGDDPVKFFSLEMGIVAVAITYILFSIWDCTVKGKKAIYLWIYMVLIINLIFDGHRWVTRGEIFHFPEILTVINFFILLIALILAKFYLARWYKN